MDPYVSSTPVGSQNMNIGPLVSGIGALDLTSVPKPTTTSTQSVVNSKDAVANLNGIQSNTNTLKTGIQQQAQNNAQQATWAAVGAQSQAQYDQIVKSSQDVSKKAADASTAQTKAIADATNAVNGTAGQGMTGQQFLNQFGRAPTPQEVTRFNVQGAFSDDGSGNKTPIVGVPDTTVDSGQSGTTDSSDSSNTDFGSQISANQNSRDTITQSYTDQINKIFSGVFPLNSTQQALVDSLKNSLATAEQAQRIANQNYSGGVDIANIASGRNKYAPEIAAGQVQAAVTAGIQKIQDLDNTAAQNLAKLQQGFQTDDLTAVKDAYDATISNLDAKTKIIQDLQTTATAAAKDARDFYQTNVTTPINNLSTDAAKNGAPSSVQAKIQGAKSVSDAISAAGDWLQTSSDPLTNAYLQYKRDNQAKGQPIEDFNTFSDAYNKKAENLDVDKAARIAYATAQAKALADAKAGVLNSQQNSDVNAAQTQLNSSQETKDLSNITSALTGIKGIPATTTDPVQQKALLFALARALVPGSTSVRSAIGQLDPNGLNSDAYNLLKSGEGVFSSSGKAKLSPTAVTSIYNQIQNLQTSAVDNYTTKRNDMITALNSRVPNSAQYLPDYSDSGSLSAADKLNAINSSVLSWKSSAPPSDVSAVNNAAAIVAKNRGVPLSSLTASDYQDIIQGSPGLKTKYTKPF